MLWMSVRWGGANSSLRPMRRGFRLLPWAGVFVRLRNAAAPSASRRQGRSSSVDTGVVDRVLFCSVFHRGKLDERPADGSSGQ
jgi:hypothetical protein